MFGKSFKERYRKTRGLSTFPLFCGSYKLFKYTIILCFLRSSPDKCLLEHGWYKLVRYRNQKTGEEQKTAAVFSSANL